MTINREADKKLDGLVNDFIYRVEAEGYDYALIHYSDWSELKTADPELGLLIDKATEAITELEYTLKRKYAHLDQELM